MLNINKKLYNMSKKIILVKMITDFANNDNLDICILLNKNIDLNEFRKYLTKLLKKDVNTSCLTMNNDSKQYFYINTVERNTGFIGERLTFVLVSINEKILKEEYIYKIDSLTDLPLIEESEEDARKINLDSFPGGYINIDPEWRSNPFQFPSSRTVSHTIRPIDYVNAVNTSINPRLDED